jgi:hypothetical protein
MKKKSQPALFEGELSKPIVLGNRLAFGASLDRILGRCVSHQELLQYESSLATAQQVEKAHLLARRLGIEVSKPEDWGVAFVLLAEALCPGFKIITGVDYLRQRPGAPPGRRSGGAQWCDLIKEVDKRRKGESVIAACERLSKAKRGPWKGVDKLSLKARYYEQRAAHARRLREWDDWIEEMRAKLWGKTGTGHNDGANTFFKNEN